MDDTADFRYLVEQIFKRYIPAYSLRSFDSGQSFLDALPRADKRINLVILDQHMPWLNGHQTLVALKQQTESRSIPVVMMSDDASHSEITSFYQAGAATCVTKPTDFTLLKEVLLGVCQYANCPGGPEKKYLP